MSYQARKGPGRNEIPPARQKKPAWEASRDSSRLHNAVCKCCRETPSSAVVCRVCRELPGCSFWVNSRVGWAFEWWGCLLATHDLISNLNKLAGSLTRAGTLAGINLGSYLPKERHTTKACRRYFSVLMLCMCGGEGNCIFSGPWSLF